MVEQARKRRSTPSTGLQRAFFVGGGLASLLLMVQKGKDLLGREDVPALTWVLFANTFVCFVWFMLRYFRIAKGYAAEKTLRDWLVSLFIAATGLLMIHSVDSHQQWFRYAAALSFLAAVKDGQVAGYVGKTRRRHHIQWARQEMFFSISLFVISVGSEPLIQMLGGVYAGLYVVVECVIKARSLARSGTKLNWD